MTGVYYFSWQCILQRGQKCIFSAPPARRYVNQEGWHNWHFPGFTLAGLCFLGLRAGIYRLTQHTMPPPTPLVMDMPPVPSWKASGKLQWMNGHCLERVQVLNWEESLAGQFRSPRSACALYHLWPRPDTGPNQQKETSTIVNGRLVSSQNRCCL